MQGIEFVRRCSFDSKGVSQMSRKMFPPRRKNVRLRPSTRTRVFYEVCGGCDRARRVVQEIRDKKVEKEQKSGWEKHVQTVDYDVTPGVCRFCSSGGNIIPVPKRKVR